MDSAGAEGPDTLPPMLQGKEAGGEGAGGEGPDTPAAAPTSATSSWQRAASAWGTTSRRTARVD